MRAVGELADGQHGTVARGQLLEQGVSGRAIERLVRAGTLIPLHRGVYAAGHRRLRREGHWMSSVLACRPDGLLSHRSAATLWELAADDRSLVHVTVPRQSHRRRPGIRIHRAPTLAAADTTTHRGIPTTTPARTLLDLAEITTRRELERALDQAVVADLFDLVALEAAIARAPNRHGARRLARALGEHEAGTTLTESALEEAFFALARTAGLQAPQTQRWFGTWRADFYWPAERIAVEAHSHRYHRPRVEADHAKAAFLAAEGIHLLAFTHAQIVHRPAEVLAALAGALRRSPSRRKAS